MANVASACSHTWLPRCPNVGQRLELFQPIRYHARLKFQGKPVESAGTSGAVQPGRSLRKFGLAFVLMAGFMGPALARAALSDEAVVALASLPAEARQTEQLIRQRGPFPYAKDGSVFGNREYDAGCGSGRSGDSGEGDWGKSFYE